MELLPVFEQKKSDVIQDDSGGGSGGVGDDVGDIAGAECEGELAELQREAEEESGQDGSESREIQHFQVDAEREEEQDIQKDFLDVEADADVAFVVERDEVDAARRDQFRNFAEGEGGFEEDAPQDEQEIEEKQDVGEGEFTVLEHGQPLSWVGVGG